MFGKCNEYSFIEVICYFENHLRFFYNNNKFLLYMYVYFVEIRVKLIKKVYSHLNLINYLNYYDNMYLTYNYFL
jgi:hypothetical protein